MATIETAFVAWADSQPAISRLLGNRIFPIEAPKTAAYPRLVYRVMHDHPLEDLDGETGTTTVVIRAEVFGDDPLTIKQAVAIVGGLKTFARFRGTVDGVVIQGVHRLDGADHAEKPAAGENTGTFSTHLDFAITYEEGS